MATATILIFEPDAIGHQMEYLRYLLSDIARQVPHARIILLTTDEAAEHPACRAMLGDFSELVTVQIAPAVPEGHRLFRMVNVFYETQWKNAERLARGLGEIGANRIDFVLVPHMETIGLLHLFLRPDLFRDRPWAAIAVSFRFHLRKAGIEGSTRWLDLLHRGFLSWIMRRPDLTCMGTISALFPVGRRYPKIAYCVEPSEPPAFASIEVARSQYGIRPETCLVLVFGFIDKRKCVEVLLEGVARLQPDVDVTVLLAGAQHPKHVARALTSDVARTLRESGRLIEVNRFLVPGRDIDPMWAADISWVFYADEVIGNSNVLVRSALMRRPVIARRRGVIGRLVEDHELGLAVPSGSPEDIAAALTRLARDPDLRRRMGENGAQVFAEHTPENFARPIARAISRRLAGERTPAGAANHGEPVSDHSVAD
jgi:glycosyltransferase involved in cell wall biosynthesis